MIDEQPIDEQPKKRRGSFWRELPILLGVAIVVAVLVRAFVVQTFWIPSGSMEHTLVRDDRVLVNKVVYHFREPARGEIIVFRAPDAWSTDPDSEDYIKRVVGVGGDHIRCCDEQGRLVINGQSLDEPYIYSRGGHTDPAASGEFEAVVPDGRLWVLGDHRSASGDSMDHFRRSGGNIEFATIDVDSVIGRAFVLFWPFSRATWLSVPDSYGPVPDQPPARPAGARQPD